jgi:hypothetical protein
MLEQSSAAQQLFADFVRIGSVVQDIDQSMKVLSEVFGISPWRVILWPPEGRTDRVASTRDGRLILPPAWHLRNSVRSRSSRSSR